MRLVVFDLWGTLFWKDKWSALRKKYGITGKIGSLIMTQPLTSQQAAERLIKRYGLKVLPEDLARELEQSTREASPVPGALETLAMLREKRIKTGLCSNTFQTAFQTLNRKWDLRRKFDCIFLSYEQGMLKPDPKALLYCPNKLGITPAETMMVGDRIDLDVTPAQEQGMLGVLFDPKNKHPEFSPRISEIREVMRLAGTQRKL